MLEEIAEIISIEEHALIVDVKRQSVCGKCSAQNACGHQLLQKWFPQRSRVLHVAVSPEAKTTLKDGDQIRIGIREDAVIKASMLVYGLPLLSMIIGMLILQIWNAGGWGAIIGLLIGFALVSHTSRHWQQNEKYASFYQAVFLGPTISEAEVVKVLP